MIVQFVNDTAAKEIVNYENPCGKPIDDSKLNYTVKKINTSQDETQHYHNDEGGIISSSLSKTLQSHVNIIENNIEAIYSIEILDNRKSDDSWENSNSKYYNLKTIRVNFGSNKKSFIHVFINTTSVKHFEMEKARNECLQLMFSSVSHEFRTPLNAFTNSIVLLENNYNCLLQNIKTDIKPQLFEKLLPAKLKESNERFFKIWKKYQQQAWWV